LLQPPLWSSLKQGEGRKSGQQAREASRKVKEIIKIIPNQPLLGVEQGEVHSPLTRGGFKEEELGGGQVQG